MENQAAILVENVHKSFGEVHALAGVDLTAPAGQVFGLLGPNGAGKTTLVRVLTTLLKPDQGRAFVAGLNVVDDARSLRHIIGLAGQYAAVDEILTGRENLIMVGQLYHLSHAEAKRRADNLLERFSLTAAADRPARQYSGGMRHRLDLAASLVGRPQVLFLDEPTTGLDPRTRLELWDVIRELVRDGTTLLLTTQYLEEADELADRLAVIDHGKIIAEGTPDELKMRMGSDVIEVKLANALQTEQALELIRPIATEAPIADAAAGVIKIPAKNGVETMIKTVRQIDGSEIEVIDLRLRRPSLDEVFLSLTGRPATGKFSAHDNQQVAAEAPGEIGRND